MRLLRCDVCGGGVARRLDEQDRERLPMLAPWITAMCDGCIKRVAWSNTKPNARKREEEST